MLYELAIVAAAVAFSFGIDAVAVPRAPLRRPLAAVALHIAVLAVVAGASLAITGRPIFSMFVVAVLVAVFAVISNAKYQSLREPLVFTDLSLFSQAFSHPRLYLPFLGVVKGLTALAGAAVIVTGFLLETPADTPHRGAGAVAAIAGFLLCRALSQRLFLTLGPTADQRRLGFLATFAAYLINGLSRAKRHVFARAVDTGPFSSGAPEAHPDVIVIQSESYFDARRLGECVRSGPYAHFDRVRKTAFQQGRLTVPGWGANTMRTEFGMLTGVPSAALGYARFYPYWYVRRACASLAGWFKRGGYRAVAVHPYYADFFGRHRAFRLMQFDRFLDIRDFAAAPRVGPYVGDDAVADAIVALLQERDDKPLFAFAITMENHGPLHLEPVAPGESDSRHTLGDDARYRDLTAYLRHVENADRMLGKLTDFLEKRKRPAVLCFYGDHVPALSSVFDSLGTEPADSDYVIWRNFGVDEGKQKDVRVESLGSALQRAMTHEAHATAGWRDETQLMPA
ncbi:LTA synthase family protein [Paraburkholderia dinghuensis]|uniref:LTA synthase family protein n=1 Tax=Paraburkholderia dinghuensis TaxID=2305225 RepID=A0A3N6P7N2_9BURK|nr:LTA synthase family protein [Paraburkholderia dinghuensis]RQH10073.1 LTA synthase family protein [Paraburkholderia dinghuensis]